MGVTREQYLSGRILLAMPGMFDPRFERSVTVMCVHDEHGALGIGIGHVRARVRFHEILRELGLDPGMAPDCAVLNGGPVEPGRGFILHSTDWGGGDTIEVQPLCALSASLDVLYAITEGRGPSHWLMALGYAGWGAGQLESEMRQHGWYAAEGHREVLFDTPPEARWMATWRAEGIDPALLSNATGRA
ncbi:putative transcriptional regulator [Novosphingobium sp. CF614]|uniref:YqgE/AlgH family protein n=1 Tax=Novosphingobium sp. CF614 TaxID=1884364 RepID=UPI0008E7EF41|nr:YqgE/AlgH family protein [Novosphingobium sp. CF614]SFF87793.1 putative transcriptional regulator [Novosphingobium sp. CF614]